MAFVRILLPLLVVAAAFAGCGETAATGGSDEALAGPPRWRQTKEGAASDANGLALNIRTPVRVRLRQAGTEVLTQASPWRTLAAGQTLHVVWGHAPEPRRGEVDRPGSEDKAAGRTELHAVQTHHQFADDAVRYNRIAAFTRPGMGRLMVDNVLPPGGYEELPTKASIELLTIAIPDVADGEVGLRRRGREVRIQHPGTLGPDDRITVWLVFLDIEPLGN